MNQPYNIIDNKIAIQGYMGGSSAPKPKLPKEAPEGIKDRFLPDTGLAVSLTQIEVMDVISEGEIEGLVSGDYYFSGVAGEIGWRTGIFTPYPYASGTTARWMRSIYWNDVPLVDSDNKFNFQRIQAAYTNGSPGGVLWKNLNSNLSNNLQIAKGISERLRGGEDKFAKIYRILNKNIKGVRVNVKVGNLSATASEKKKETKEITKIKKDGKVVTKQKKEVTERVGDTVQTEIDYEIYSRPIFSTPGLIKEFELQIKENIDGKISNGYIRSSYISLLDTEKNDISNRPDFIGWEIKVKRTTPDSETTTIRNQSFVDSIIEIYGDVFTYPNTAIVSSRFSAEYFSQIPVRLFDTKLLKVKVPFNYNTLTKNYSGVWDGTFKETKQWTDNPAWIYYDLLTNPRYGLGKYLTEDNIDKWTLYDIGQYCDTLVPDGFGGLEPRMTCNVILNSRGEAYEIVNNLASTFRGMTYYSNNLIYAVQDSEKPKDSFYLFTNANVENGNFVYQSSSKRVRNTIAIIRYNDKTNFYRPAIEYVEDIDAIRKYGLREIEIPAFGCTNRGQALRLGRWALLTETLETESINFNAGLEAIYLRPGDIIKVFDVNRRETRLGGRTTNISHNVNYSTVTLDSNITNFENTKNYQFSLLTPSYFYDSSLVNITGSSQISKIRKNQIQILDFIGQEASGIIGPDGKTKTQITFDTSFNTGDYNVSGNLIWTIEGDGTYNLNTNPTAEQYDYYRILKIEEKEPHKYSVMGIQYDESKFGKIESGFMFSNQELRELPNPPRNLGLTLENQPNLLHTKRILYKFDSPENTDNLSSFPVYIKSSPFLPGETSRESGQYLKNILFPSAEGFSSGYYYPTENKTYYFRVFSANRQNDLSDSYIENSINVFDNNPVEDIIINSLRLYNDPVETNNPAETLNSVTIEESPNIVWNLGQYNVPDISLDYRITVREPSNTNIPSKHIYYSGYPYNPQNKTEPLYIFDIGENYSAISNEGKRGPWRKYDIVVENVSPVGQSSAGGNILDINKNFDANYNTLGYDIINIDNPAPAPVTLTPLDHSTLNGFTTKQWIATDGQIKVQFIDAIIEEDVDAAYIFYSTGKFVKEQAMGTERVEFPINNSLSTNLSATNTDNTIEFNVNLTGINSAYMMLGFCDGFDTSLIPSGYLASGNPNIYSNVVEIKRQGGFDKDPLLFRAWIEFTADATTSSDGVRFQYSEAGFSTVYYDATKNIEEFNFLFDVPLAINNYTVFIQDALNRLKPEEIVLGYDRIKIKKEFLKLFNSKNNANNKIFVGILWNSLEGKENAPLIP